MPDEPMVKLLFAIARRAARAARVIGDEIEDFAVNFAVAMVEPATRNRWMELPEQRRLAYLWLSARRFAWRAARTERRAEVLHVIVDGRDVTARSAGRMDPQRVIASSEALEAVLHAVDRLSESHRQVFVDRVQHEHSIQEIAHISGRTEGAIRRCLCDARRQLRDDLIRHGWSKADLASALSPPQIVQPPVDRKRTNDTY
jgi:RNA polymerase sigma factor (sigma-70 family)